MRAYHAPNGNPCKRCNLPISRHWCHKYNCNCGAQHRTKPRPRETRTRRDRRYWVGLDGEGIGRAPHRYVLLAYSDATGRVTDSIRDDKGLTTRDCFDLLLSIPTDARVAGYYLGYDWTKILTDLPAKAIYDLLRPERRYLGADEGGQCRPIRWRGYIIQYLARMVRIRRLDRSTTIWDVGAYYQAPFAKALKAWSIGTASELSNIETMKAQRSQFDTTHDIESYCLSECRLLAELVTELDQAHTDIGLPLRSYHGPGSTANVALRAMGIHRKRGKIPAEVANGARYAFFGGRFEHPTAGEVGDVYGLDIVSAYPFQAYNLPCLEHGTWTHIKRESKLSARALVRYSVSDIGDESWGPLPCRENNGCIVWARGGFSGWVWAEEYRLARDHWPGIHFHEAWNLESDCDCKPFARVLEWFRERELFGKDGRGRIIKLILNSIYGKMAQQVGRPQYRSLVWAGMITSGTRSELLRIVARYRESVLGVATDGLFSRAAVDIPAGPLDPDRLGSWETKRHENLTLVRPGIYWTDDIVKARGLGSKQLSEYRAKVKRAIRRGEPEVRTGEAPVFWAARQAVMRSPKGVVKRHRLYGEWIERPVRISLSPLPKRNPDWSLRMLDNIESAPYGKKTPDGAKLKAVADALWGQPI